MNNVPVTEVQQHKHLGLTISHNLRWSSHIDYVLAKAYKRINIMRKFKFILDRSSLETIYLSFIRPILEYGDILFDNCTQQESESLEQVQQEAARITTGATKLVSVQKLMSDLGWDSLKVRRNKHKLVLFYKMINNLTPPYLSSIVPSQVNASSRYHFRNDGDYQLVYARTSLYYNSFLPSVVRDFNSLPANIRSANTIVTFKKLLFANKHSVPSFFNHGTRKQQVLHARLRTNCSSLANDLYTKNILDSPNCSCGQVETTTHYFLRCPRFDAQRTRMLEAIANICPVSLKLLLFGDPKLNDDSNSSIFSAVHTYIIQTGRF